MVFLRGYQALLDGPACNEIEWRYLPALLCTRRNLPTEPMYAGDHLAVVTVSNLGKWVPLMNGRWRQLCSIDHQDWLLALKKARVCALGSVSVCLGCSPHPQKA